MSLKDVFLKKVDFIFCSFLISRSPSPPSLSSELSNIGTRLESGFPVRIEALTSLQQTREALDDPLVQGMLESLMTQLKRGVLMREEAGLRLNQELPTDHTEDLNNVRLEPGQVVIKGE